MATEKFGGTVCRYNNLRHHWTRCSMFARLVPCGAIPHHAGLSWREIYPVGSHLAAVKSYSVRGEDEY